jgi:geranylgeranyl pyrophosphate synthase
MACAFYQVANDYSDIVLNEIGEGKSFCEDIAEGKFTMPTIHAIQTMKNQETLGEIFSLLKA